MKFEAPKLSINNSTLEKRKCFGILLLLGMWALVQFYLGSKYYGIIIITIFIILVVFRRRHFILLAISVVAIILFHTPTIATWSTLARSNVLNLQHPRLVLTNIFTPNSGQEVLPPQVQQMLSLLQTNHITSYKLSDQFEKDVEITQRIIEAAWPLKMDSTTHYLLCSHEEIISKPMCIVIDQREDVALAYCR